MKFKTRKQKILEYNSKYPEHTDDTAKLLKRYFSDHKLNFEKARKKASKKADLILQKRKYEHIRIVMYEYPMKTDRPRTFGGRTFSPNAHDNHEYFEKAIKSVVKSLKLINTPAEIRINVYLEMPSSIPADEVILFELKILNPIDYPDYDNVGKCYTDMLKNVLVVDDDIFYRGEIVKYYSIQPRVELIITYLTSHESDYIYKKICKRKSVKELIASGLCEIVKLTEED